MRMRHVLTASLAVMFSGLLFAQQDQGGERKPIKDSQLRVEAEIQKLEAKMAELVDQLRKKDQEHYAKKLEDGLKKLRQDRVGVNIRAVIEHLDANRIEKALEAGEDVAKALDALLALLEDRFDPEQTKKEMEAIQLALQKIDELKQKEQKIKDETNKLNKEREKEFEQARKDLEDLIKKQKELKDKTESGKPQDLMEKIEETIKEITKLQADQKQAEKELDAAKTKELRDVTEMARKLNDLIEREEKNKKALENQDASQKALDKTLAELNKAIEDQKRAAENTKKAQAAPDKANPKALEKEQKDLNDRTWALGNDLFHQDSLPKEARKQVLEPLVQASNAQDTARQELDEGALDLARGDQERAVKDLEKARDALKQLKEDADKSRPSDAAKLQKEQEQIQKESKELADAMKDAAKANESPANSKSLDNAGQKTDQAS